MNKISNTAVLVWLVIGLVVLWALPIFLFVRSNSFRARATILTEGTVVEIVDSAPAKAGHPMLIRFQAAGKSVTISHRSSSGYRVSDRVSLRYAPGEPEAAELEDSAARHPMAVLAVSIFVLLLISAAIVRGMISIGQEFRAASQQSR